MRDALQTLPHDPVTAILRKKKEQKKQKKVEDKEEEVDVSMDQWQLDQLRRKTEAILEKYREGVAVQQIIDMKVKTRKLKLNPKKRALVVYGGGVRVDTILFSRVTDVSLGSLANEISNDTEYTGSLLVVSAGNSKYRLLFSEAFEADFLLDTLELFKQIFTQINIH
eukprot:GHVR01046953.1.p1 GENE.GHVR01046953.1~~GHVR01046953.1.p1  ORF type:complete len:167 (+),score=52.09 GHVR01046953.1:250-750(+)